MKKISQEVLDRLLTAKNFLEGLIAIPIARPDGYRIAGYILTAHDAAELAIAGIAHRLDCLPRSNKSYLMDYFGPIRQKAHNEKDVEGKTFFSQLNAARIQIKHIGNFPDPNQWSRVVEKVYAYEGPKSQTFTLDRILQAVKNEGLIFI